MITSQARSHFYAIGGGKPRRLSQPVIPAPYRYDLPMTTYGDVVYRPPRALYYS